MALPAPAADRTCLVTGASSGIGVELAKLLAARGHGVTLVARREDRLKVLGRTSWPSATTCAPRSSPPTSPTRGPAPRSSHAVAERGLTVDVLVNNAGLSTTGPVAASDIAAELRMIRSDVEAVVHLCSAFVPGMVERGRGAVLNVASMAAFQPLPGQAGYAGSKSFVLSYTRALAQELRRLGCGRQHALPRPRGDRVRGGGRVR